MVERTCHWAPCGRIFFAEIKYVNRGEAKFCSHSCSTHAVNSKRPVGMSESAKHERARNIWIERHGGAEPLCIKCGDPADIHHKDGDDTNNAPKNHEALCRSHHISYENHLNPKRKRRVRIASRVGNAQGDGLGITLPLEAE
jgi:hypothetical protein